MSQVNLYLLTYLLTGMLVLVGNETISAQTYQTRIDCGSPNCEIVLDFTITAVEDTTADCGFWNLSTSYNIVSDSCNKLVSIQNFRWMNITSTGIGAELYGETVHGQSVSYQLPYPLEFQMQLVFSITTNCSGTQTSTYTHNFEIEAVDSCGWCQSRFCVNTFTCADPNNSAHEWRMDMMSRFSLWNGSKEKYLYNSDGFQFSYAAYITWPCNNYLNKPTVIDMAADLNNWLKNNGGGYAVIRYLDAGDPNFNYCKIQFKLRSPTYTLRNIEGYSAELKNCSYYQFICYPMGTQALVDSSHCYSSLRVETGNLYPYQFNNNQDEINALYENDNTQSFAVVFHPNITTNQIKVNIKSKNNSTFNIRIQGIDGKEYLYIPSAYPEMIYDLSLEQLKPGMYFLSVQDQQNGLLKVERIIKQ